MKCPACGKGNTVFKCQKCGEVRCSNSACTGTMSGKKGHASTAKPCYSCKGKYEKIS